MSERVGGPSRIAFVITALHGVAGGAERVLCDVANGLHRRGHDVTVITDQDQNGPSFYPLDFGIRRLDGKHRHGGGGGEGSPVRVVNRVAARGPLYAWVGWLLRYGPRVARFRRMLRLARPEVCIAFLPSSFPYVELARTGTRVRTIASLHNVPDRDLGGDPLRWDQNPVDVRIRRRGLHTADAITVLLPSFVDQLDPELRPKVHVVPNLVHPHVGPLADVSDATSNTVLAVGRFSPAKDHATLIRAWAELEPEHPSWRLRIVGDGPLGADLQALIDQLGLERAALDPPTPHIHEEYARASLMVVPSVHEGFGLVTVEAMAAGLPVVGFADCEGTNEIVVDGRNGLLVQPGNDRAAALAAAMRRLIDDSDERVRLAGAGPSSAAEYADGPVLDAWERVIEEVRR